MPELFLSVVNMSISASWLVAAVLVLRFFLRKAPKWVNVLLWGIVGVRLLCPFSIESALSLIPSAETIPKQVLTGPSFDIQTGIPSVDNRVNDYLGDRYYEGVTVPADNGVNVMTVLAFVWAAGVLLMLLYFAVSYWLLRRRVSTAVCFRNNIFQSENIASPFVLGIIKPRIYLPFSLDSSAFSHVVAHEMAHIQRRDHWWKPLGFLLLTVHWFNPLMWLGYILLCRDIELACDEKVIGKLEKEQRADYTQALVSCSVDRRMIVACPLAFGEVGVRERVRSVLNYKKPAFWIVVLSVIACAIVVVCFLTDPKDPEGMPNVGNVESVSAGNHERPDPMDEIVPDPEIRKLFDLDEAITAAILSRSASDEPDGLIHVESHKLFANEVMSGTPTYGSEDRGLEVIAYLVAYQAKYSVHDGTLTLVTAWCIPTAITFTIGEDGEYILKDYWEAPDGEVHTRVLYNKFPPQIVEDVLSLDCMAELKVECEEKAYEIMNGVNGDGNSDDVVGNTRISFFSNIMGCDGYIISESMGNWSSRSYYAVVDGRQWLIAESFGFGEADDYAIDFNGDGVTELVTNVQYGGDGAARVYVYQRKDDTIYMGTFSTAGLLTFDNWGANAMWSEYDSEKEKFFLHFAQKGCKEYGVLSSTNPWSFEFLEYSILAGDTHMDAAHSVTEMNIEYLLAQIESSPAHSSNPGDYIAEHQAEFDGLVDQGIYSLHYCFSEFLKGGQNDLRGHIMAAVCCEIAQTWGEGVLMYGTSPLTGQQWFDAFKVNVLSLSEQYTADELEAMYPASYLLLIMMGE